MESLSAKIPTRDVFNRKLKALFSDPQCGSYNTVKLRRIDGVTESVWYKSVVVGGICYIVSTKENLGKITSALTTLPATPLCKDGLVLTRDGYVDPGFYLGKPSNTTDSRVKAATGLKVVAPSYDLYIFTGALPRELLGGCYVYI